MLSHIVAMHLHRNAVHTGVACIQETVVSEENVKELRLNVNGTMRNNVLYRPAFRGIQYELIGHYALQCN